MALIPGIVNTFFEGYELFINGRLVSLPTIYMPWDAFLTYLFDWRRKRIDQIAPDMCLEWSTLTDIGVQKVNPNKFMDTNSLTYYGPLLIDIFQTNNNLLPGLKFELNLRRVTNEFALLSKSIKDKDRQ